MTYKWTKGTSTTSIGTMKDLILTGTRADSGSYKCSVDNGIPTNPSPVESAAEDVLFVGKMIFSGVATQYGVFVWNIERSQVIVTTLMSHEIDPRSNNELSALYLLIYLKSMRTFFRIFLILYAFLSFSSGP